MPFIFYYHTTLLETLKSCWYQWIIANKTLKALKDKLVLFYIFDIVNKSHQKTKSNIVFILLYSNLKCSFIF